MTQQATAPAPPPQQRAPQGLPSAAAARQQDAEAERFKEDTPRLLNRLQVLAITACLVFGVVAALLQVLAWQADRRAADNTEQVVRVQEIESLMLRADALATNSFLVGGLEPVEARSEYDAAITRVLSLITDAADAQPADRAALAQLSAKVSEYTNAVTQARDYNRQQLPIAIAYLNEASRQVLRGDDQYSIQNITESLATANTQRAEDEMGGHHPWLIFLFGALAVVGLWFVNRLIAQRFRRRFNVGLVVAAVIVAVLTLITALHARSENGANDETRAGPYRTAVDEAVARTAANDAKAAEALGLINRGSGSSYESALFDPASALVEENASPRTLSLWEQFLSRHDQIRDLDDAGDGDSYDEAVDLATDTGPESATAALDEVDVNAAEVVEDSAADATDELRGGGVIAIGLVVLTLLGALAAAGAIAWGINQRRREYS